MKLKILFIPFSVVIVLAIAIFSIQPAIQEVFDLKTSLAEKETMLAEVMQKVRNVGVLEGDLNQNKQSEDAVLRYLPSERDDERVTDILNFLASQHGLALASMKVEKAASVTEAVPAENPSGDPLFSSAENNAGDGMDAAAISAASRQKKIKVTAVLNGSYDNIRNFFNSLSHVDRMDDISVVKVAKADVPAAAEGSEEAVSNDTLLANFDIYFDYFPKHHVTGTSGMSIFSKSKMDFSLAERVITLVSSPVPNLESSATGKVNPFLR